MARCAKSNSMNSLLLAVYLILTNILLINILIAMFSYSFQKIHNNSELIWKFHRFRLIREYYYKSTFAPPLNILNYLFRKLKCCKPCTEIDKFNKDATEVELDQMHLFEKVAVENCLSISSELEGYRDTQLQSTEESQFEDNESDSDRDQFDTFRRNVAQSLKEIRLELNSVRDTRMTQNLRQTEMDALRDLRHTLSTKTRMQPNVLLVEVPHSGVQEKQAYFLNSATNEDWNT